MSCRFWVTSPTTLAPAVVARPRISSHGSSVGHGRSGSATLTNTAFSLATENSSRWWSNALLMGGSSDMGLTYFRGAQPPAGSTRNPETRTVTRTSPRPGPRPTGRPRPCRRPRWPRSTRNTRGPPHSRTPPSTTDLPRGDRRRRGPAGGPPGGPAPPTRRPRAGGRTPGSPHPCAGGGGGGAGPAGAAPRGERGVQRAPAVPAVPLQEQGDRRLVLGVPPAGQE